MVNMIQLPGSAESRGGEGEHGQRTQTVHFWRDTGVEISVRPRAYSAFGWNWDGGQLRLWSVPRRVGLLAPIGDRNHFWYMRLLSSRHETARSIYQIYISRISSSLARHPLPFWLRQELKVSQPKVAQLSFRFRTSLSWLSLPQNSEHNSFDSRTPEYCVLLIQCISNHNGHLTLLTGATEITRQLALMYSLTTTLKSLLSRLFISVSLRIDVENQFTLLMVLLNVGVGGDAPSLQPAEMGDICDQVTGCIFLLRKTLRLSYSLKRIVLCNYF